MLFIHEVHIVCANECDVVMYCIAPDRTINAQLSLCGIDFHDNYITSIHFRFSVFVFALRVPASCDSTVP